MARRICFLRMWVVVDFFRNASSQGLRIREEILENRRDDRALERVLAQRKRQGNRHGSFLGEPGFVVSKRDRTSRFPAQNSDGAAVHENPQRLMGGAAWHQAMPPGSMLQSLERGAMHSSRSRAAKSCKSVSRRAEGWPFSTCDTVFWKYALGFIKCQYALKGIFFIFKAGVFLNAPLAALTSRALLVESLLGMEAVGGGEGDRERNAAEGRWKFDKLGARALPTAPEGGRGPRDHCWRGRCVGGHAGRVSPPGAIAPTGSFRGNRDWKLRAGRGIRGDGQAQNTRRPFDTRV